jgi:diguanylate cyclase (GGDEF)-like protein
LDPISESNCRRTGTAGDAQQDGEKRMRILAAEDDPVFSTVLRMVLTGWGYDVLAARNGIEALELLQSDEAPRLAILDWEMPGMDGVEICQRIRAENRGPYIYILLLTARKNDLVEGMDSGADDYLTKPLNAHELRVRLRAGRRIVDLQEELLRTREALREQATHDALTGLLNRPTVLERLRNEVARACRENQPISVLMVDLDRFKLINDTYGHLAGDTVLREVAQRMTSAVRRYDAVARYGGEEFLIVLAGCDDETARSQAERVRIAVGDGPVLYGDTGVPVTCSIGVSCRRQVLPGDVESLIRESDVALYQAKRRGRNRVERNPANTDLPNLAASLVI